MLFPTLKTAFSPHSYAYVSTFSSPSQLLIIKGGAYGGGARHSNGILSFYSYRDPNTLETLEAFNNAIAWAANGEYPPEVFYLATKNKKKKAFSS